MASLYWAIGERPAEGRDLGHRCKECKKEFRLASEPIMLRRGGRIELRYHKHCFSGEADPRTQANSSFAVAENARIVAKVAPMAPYKKMRTSSQF